MPVLLGYVATSRDDGRLMSVNARHLHFSREGRICEVLCALFHEEMFANVDIQSRACVVYPAST